MALPDGFDLDEFVTRVLAEDLGQRGDVTSTATIDDDARFTAAMNARQSMVVAGAEIAAAFFKALDPDVNVEILIDDGTRAEHGTCLMRLAGKARANMVSVMGVRRDKAALSSGCKAHPAIRSSRKQSEQSWR